MSELKPPSVKDRERATSVRVAGIWLSLLILTPGPLAGAPQTNSTTSRQSMTLLEAVRYTLQNDPILRVQERQVDAAKGLFQTAVGQFDPLLYTALSRGLTRTPRSETDLAGLIHTNILDTVSDITTYRIGITQQFRSGISISPGVELNRYVDNLDQEAAANRANVNLVIKVPLLKGAGKNAVAAQERAAWLNYEATVLDLQQTISSRILNTVSAYWTCLGAQQQLQVLKNSQVRAGELVGAVRELVRIGEMAGSELSQAEGDLAQKDAARVAGQQAFWQAQQELAQAIGLELSKIPEPPTPESDFPAPVTNTAAFQLSQPGLLMRSLERRADYQALQKAQQGAQVLETAARLNTRPQVDFTFEAGYSGLDEGSQFQRFYGSLDPRAVSGPNLFGMLSLEWPFGNHAARGVLAQRHAEQQQILLRIQALARSIYSGIATAIEELERTRLELEQRREAISKYGYAVAQEREKLRLGTVTILDVITLTDRMNEAELNAVTAQARHAIAVAKVRYETGYLMRSGVAPEMTLTIQDLIALPSPESDETRHPLK